MMKFRSMAEIDAQTDEELVRRAQAGEAAAFDQLYDRYLTVVYRRVTCSIPQADIEDVTQEVFIAVIRSLGKFRGDAKFRTWLYTILSRKIADYYRRRDPADFEWKDGRDNDGDGDDEDDATNPVENLPDGTSFSALDDAILVRQGLLRLSPAYREVILLRFADDLTFAEIAAHLGLSLEATKSLFRRAISSLQEVLESAYD